MVDGAGGRTLWTTVSLEDLTVDSHNLPLIERYSSTVHSKTLSLSLSCRAADCGNREAIIKLAVAFLYNQGGEYTPTHRFPRIHIHTAHTHCSPQG